MPLTRLRRSDESEDGGGIDFDPLVIERKRAARARAYHTLQIPWLRLIGSLLLALVVFLHQKFVAGTPDVAWVAPLLIGYAVVSWPVIRLLYGKTGRIDLSLLFLIVDVPLWTLAIYATGGEHSWIFLVLLLRVVDQTHTSFRRALFFGHLVTASYLLMAAYLQVFERHDIHWPEELAKVFFMYAGCLYTSLVAHTAERHQQRTAAAFRLTRDLVRQLQEKSMQLDASRAEMLRAKNAAEAANLAKSQFLAAMSHELRTPLNGILGMAQLLLMPKLSDEERREFPQTILASGKTLLAILNDILDLSKVEAGKVELQCSAFQPAQLIDETAALFSEQAQAKGLAIEIAWHGPADARYSGDPARLRQMLSNLVSNAIKFTAQGFVRIEGCVVECHGGQAVLEFSVTDSGIGVPEDKQGLLFKPFSQVDGSITREYGGTGLGLSIVRNLARLMQGDSGIESAAGKGARVWFRIQASQLTGSEEGRLSERDAWLREAGAAQPAASGYILIAEDNQTNRKVIEALLNKLGLRFVSVENGEDALNAVTGGAAPDLILMDCQMPVMDGNTATEKIRQWEREGGRSRLPIVALTAGAYPEDRERCLAAGMDDFLSKPLELNSLLAVLEKWQPRR